MKKIISGLVFILISFPVLAQNTKVFGKVTDAATKESLPFVNLVFKGTQIGTTTDMDGRFLIETSQKVDSLVVSSVGYLPLAKAVVRNKPQTINFELEVSSVELREVIIKPGENPAHAILRNIIDNKEKNDKEKLDAYQYEVYNKVEFDLNNIPEEYKNKRALRKFKFIFDNIDSSGTKPYLPMFMTESLSEVYYRKKPKTLKEFIKAVKVSGVKNESINQFLGDVYQSVNVYDNFILVFGKSFVSPIADFGLLYYKYYLVDSASIDDQWCYKVTFMPRRRQEPTFAGEFWVHDTTFALKKFEVSIASDANINFVNSFYASQEFTMVDSAWMLKKDNLMVDFNVAKKTMGIYGRKTATYKNIVVNKPKEDVFYSGTENIIVAEDASEKKEEYWAGARHDTLSDNEKSIYSLVDSIQNIPIFKTYVEYISMFISGYRVWGNLELGPYYTTYSFNKVEGSRFRLGGRTSNAFSKRLMISGYAAYGLEDEVLKYGGSFQYFLSKQPRLFIGGSYKFDMEQLGQSPNALRQDNILSSAFRRNPFNKLTLVEDYTGYIEREWFSGFSNRLTLTHRTLHPQGALSYEYRKEDGGIAVLPNITTSEAIFFTRFAYKEKFVSGEFERISMGTKYPILQFQYTLGLKGVLESDYQYHKFNISIKNFIRTQPFGYLDYMFEAGKTIGNVPYPLLELHNGNETRSYDPYAFNMMNYFEFVSDQYFSASFTQHFNGFFLDKIPLLRKAKLREVVLAKGVIGSLNETNRNILLLPGSMSTLSKPYVEAGIGVENIFRLLRIDGLWRMTYIDKEYLKEYEKNQIDAGVPNSELAKIHRFGIRLTFVFSF